MIKDRYGVKSKYKNKMLWTAVASLILLSLVRLGIILDVEPYKTILESILSILVLLGILNNPEKE